MTYGEKLQDPRWQRKRMEIWKEYGGFCQFPGCENPHSRLEVHHKAYRRNVEPWDYPIWCFTLYCEEHHQIEQARMEQAHMAIASNPQLISYCIGHAIEIPTIVAVKPATENHAEKITPEHCKSLFDEMRRQINES